MQWACSHCHFRNHDELSYCERCNQRRHNKTLHTYYRNPFTDETFPGADITYELQKPEGRSQPAEKPPTKKELRQKKKLRKKKARAKAKTQAKSPTLATADADGTSSHDPSTNPLAWQCNYFSNSSEEENAQRELDIHGPDRSGTRWEKGASTGTIGDPSSNPGATGSGYITYNSEEYVVAATVATQRPASTSSSGVPFEVCYLCKRVDAQVYFRCSSCSRGGRIWRIAICQECVKSNGRCPNCDSPIEEFDLEEISGMSNEVSTEELEGDDPRNADCPVQIFYH